MKNVLLMTYAFFSLITLCLQYKEAILTYAIILQTGKNQVKHNQSLFVLMPCLILG